jgi:hypothetical protein
VEAVETVVGPADEVERVATVEELITAVEVEEVEPEPVLPPDPSDPIASHTFESRILMVRPVGLLPLHVPPLSSVNALATNFSKMKESAERNLAHQRGPRCAPTGRQRRRPK